MDTGEINNSQKNDEAANEYLEDPIIISSDEDETGEPTNSSPENKINIHETQGDKSDQTNSFDKDGKISKSAQEPRSKRAKSMEYNTKQGETKAKKDEGISQGKENDSRLEKPKKFPRNVRPSSEAKKKEKPAKEIEMEPGEVSSVCGIKRRSQGASQMVQSKKIQKKENKIKEGKPKVPNNLKVGFIGAGGPMCEHLINHLCRTNENLVLWNHDNSFFKGLFRENLKVTTSVDELFAESDVIIWFALNKSLSNKLFYCHFAFKNKLQGKYLIDLTNTDPQNALEVYDTVHDEGGFYLDGRLHGGVQEASEGTLVTFTSGDLVVHEACVNLLQTFSKKVNYFGSQPEKAARVSALINVVKAINIEAVHLMHTFAEAQDVVSLEDLKKFATSPLGPLTKKAVEHTYHNTEDRLYQLETCKEDIESIIFRRRPNKSRLLCTQALYQFICNYHDEEPPSAKQQNVEERR